LVPRLVVSFIGYECLFSTSIQDYDFGGLKPSFLIGVENGCWFHCVYSGESSPLFVMGHGGLVYFLALK
jgi:hypothetical protein